MADYTPILHCVKLYVEAKDIKTDDDVKAHVWLEYLGDPSANKVGNNMTNEMSFGAWIDDFVTWEGVAVKEVQQKDGVLQKYKEDEQHYHIVMTGLICPTDVNFIKSPHLQNPAGSHIAAFVNERVQEFIEEYYQLQFSIVDAKSGKEVGSFTWDPKILNKSR